MSKKTTAWLITATALVLVGCLLFGGIMMALKWDFTKLSTAKPETKEYPITQAYHNIALNTATADIAFVPSEDGTTKVVFYKETHTTLEVNVKDDTLYIDSVDTRKWYEHIGIGINSASITVYLPQGNYGALTVNATTGDIDIPAAFTFESIAVDVTTGDIFCNASALLDVALTATTGDIAVEGVNAASLFMKVTSGDITATAVNGTGDVSAQTTTGKATFGNVRCTNLQSNGGTGDLTLTDVIASQAFTLKRTTGDIVFDRCDAAKIAVSATTGDITGSLLSDKVFLAETTTGDVIVPAGANGGTCEITTNTGDIVLTVE